MTSGVAYFLAIVSTAAFVALWFWVARRELYARQKTVEAARRQLTASRQQVIRARDGPGAAQAKEIRERSQSIYRQAAALYNKTLRKPWNAVPAFFFGFRPAGADGEGG